MRLKNVLCTACAAAFAAVMFFGFNVRSFAADTYEGIVTVWPIESKEIITDEDGSTYPAFTYGNTYDLPIAFSSDGIVYGRSDMDSDPFSNMYAFYFEILLGQNKPLAPETRTVTVTFPVNMIQDDHSYLAQLGPYGESDIPYTLSGNQLTLYFDGLSGSEDVDTSSGEEVILGYHYTFVGGFTQGKSASDGNNSYNANLESKANLINYYSGLGEGQKEPAVVELNEGDALNDGLIKAMSEAKNVVLKFTYTYEGVQYLTTVTPEAAKAAYDPEIPWYGPLFLRAHFPTVVVE